MADTSKHVTYEDAGVDTAEGARAVDAIKQMVAETNRPEVVGGIGGFGGLFSAAALKDMEDPILISGTDGVGIGWSSPSCSTVMRPWARTWSPCASTTSSLPAPSPCSSSITWRSAISRLPRWPRSSRAWRMAASSPGCALVGGEMAEHPGVMRPDDYDLAGFAVGVVDRPKMIDPANVQAGDVILGLPSTGVHSNGYSLVRKVIGVDGMVPGTPEAEAKRAELEVVREDLGGVSLADALLAPTRIYVKPVLELLRGGAPVHALAHITGGGITENLDRALPKNVDALVSRDGDKMGWSVPPVITYISQQAQLAPNEACKTFNMGVGLCIICAPEDEANIVAALENMGERPFRVGTCIEGSGKVVYTDEQ